MKTLGMDNYVGTQTLTYGGAGTAVTAGLALNEWGVIIGILVGVSGLGFQVWLGIQRNRRERALHRKRMNDTADE